VIVGIPKEIKPNESRVAIIPAGVEALTKKGHSVFIETEAGKGSGFSDEDYRNAGANILNTPAEVFQVADLVLKVKEPLPPEYELFKEDQLLFTYLHLAAEPKLTEALIRKRVTAIAYETIQLEDHSLPLLTPMSEVAGRMAVQIGAMLLEKHYGGKGLLLGGVPGTHPAKVLILGGGIVGTNAAKIAIGFGADVTILDINLDRLRYLDDIFQGRVKTLMSNTYNIREEAKNADLLIGAVLIPGAKAPRLVTEAMVKDMQAGSVIVDVAIDQGGSIETIDRVTTHANPAYEKHGVIHYSVANMPGAVARTSTFALTNTTLPYLLALANKGFLNAVKSDPSLAKGVNVMQGRVTYQAVAEAHNLTYYPLADLLLEKAGL
jgi:alanine dehydrogenase